jgi:hypothetical protein
MIEPSSDEPKMFAEGNKALVKRSKIVRWTWWTPILAVLTLAAFAVVAVRSLLEPVLRAAGWALVANEPVAPADIIVLSLESGGAGALEAADLVQSGISKRVAVFQDPPSGEDYEFIRRGLPYDDEGARQIRQLTSLGVTDVVQISRIDGTEGEGQVLPLWCDEQHFRSIVMVATKDHSRRLRRVLDRVMEGHPTQVTVQALDASNGRRARLQGAPREGQESGRKPSFMRARNSTAAGRRSGEAILA